MPIKKDIIKVFTRTFMISEDSISKPHKKSAPVQGKPLTFKLDDLFSVLVVVSGYFPKDQHVTVFISSL